MNKADLLEKASSLNISSVSAENTNAEIEEAINDELANPTQAASAAKPTASTGKKKGKVKYIRYPNGTETIVKASDAQAHAARIEEERQPPIDKIKNGTAKRFRVEIIDEPSYVGGEKP